MFRITIAEKSQNPKPLPTSFFGIISVSNIAQKCLILIEHVTSKYPPLSYDLHCEDTVLHTLANVEMYKV